MCIFGDYFLGCKRGQYLVFNKLICNAQRQPAGDHLPFLSHHAFSGLLPKPLYPLLDTSFSAALGEFSTDGLANVTRFCEAETVSKTTE